jgi:CheY-like chemotaxis protein
MITNAAKYGALSDNGFVSISWEMTETGLELSWREEGGPAVTAPTRRGLGSTIIESSIPHNLGGRAEVRFKLTGLEVDLAVPSRLVEEPPIGGRTHEAKRMDEDQPQVPLAGCAVLLLEDNLMVALDCEAALSDLGAREIHIAASLEAAAALLAEKSIDFAVLDLNLGPETSVGFASDLAARSIPFIFATGYGENAVKDGPHAGRISVSKPYTASDLRGAVAAELNSEYIASASRS